MEKPAALKPDPRAMAAWKKYVELRRAKHEKERLQALELIREAWRNGEYDLVSDPPVPLPPLESLYKRKNIEMPALFKKQPRAQSQGVAQTQKKLEILDLDLDLDLVE